MLEHRRTLIPDFDAFEDAIATEPDTFLRANALRMPGPQLAARLRAAGIEVEPLPFSPHALRVRAGLALPGATLEHALGLYHIQGATSMLAPLALDLRPGQSVLDLCAAPGSKTTQIAELLGHRGFVLANDPFVDRLAILKHHLERLGHRNVCIARCSGAAFPDGLLFDRVLVDAPCSGEGTRRRTHHAPRERAPHHSAADGERLRRLQRTLLMRAANLVRPGGLIVYSTCTYGPEENEAVVAHVLARRPDLRLEPPPEALGGEPGLTAWAGERFGEALASTRRFYPHRGLNAAGFFIARLRRDPDPPRRHRTPPPANRRSPDAAARARAEALAARARAYMAQRFGIHLDALPEARTIGFGRTLWLVSPELPDPHTLAAWRVQNPGLRLVRERSSRLKPTTHGLIALGARLERAVIEIEPAELRTLLAGALVERDRAAGAIDELVGGYAAVRCRGWTLGCVFVQSRGLASQIPRHLARRLQESLFCLGNRERLVADAPLPGASAP